MERVNHLSPRDEKMLRKKAVKQSKFAKIFAKVGGAPMAHDGSSDGSKEEEIVASLKRAKEKERDGTESLTSLEEVKSEEMSCESVKINRLGADDANGQQAGDGARLEGEESVGTMDAESVGQWRTAGAVQE